MLAKFVCCHMLPIFAVFCGEVSRQCPTDMIKNILQNLIKTGQNRHHFFRGTPIF